MAYDEGVAERLREAMAGRPGVTEKKMFGGLALMVRGNMLMGVLDDSLMARVGPELYEDVLEKDHVREMDFTGKPLKGYVFVDADGFESDADLLAWVELCLRFNATLPAK